MITKKDEAEIKENDIDKINPGLVVSVLPSRCLIPTACPFLLYYVPAMHLTWSETSCVR